MSGGVPHVVKVDVTLVSTVSSAAGLQVQGVTPTTADHVPVPFLVRIGALYGFDQLAIFHHGVTPHMRGIVSFLFDVTFVFDHMLFKTIVAERRVQGGRRVVLNAAKNFLGDIDVLHVLVVTARAFVLVVRGELLVYVVTGNQNGKVSHDLFGRALPGYRHMQW